MSTNSPDQERLLQLLAGRALGDLDREETRELDSVIAKLSPGEASSSRRDLAELERLKGTMLLGWDAGGAMQSKLSPELRGRILSAGRSMLKRGESASPPRRGMRPREGIAWFLAAASIALAVFAWNRPGALVAPTPSWRARQDLLQQPDSTKLAWSTTDDPEAKGVSGDIVWNSQQQKGYMRFKGLASNDPRLQQYQLWIFDKGREGDFPVDGGVFDINSASKDPSTGDLVVPIAPKLAVRNPAMFAVTMELPGGVVVTKKERLLLLAKSEAN